MAAYRVAVEDEGCPHCGAGKYWIVVGPDGSGGTVSYSTEEAAETQAVALNLACDIGREAKVFPKQFAMSQDKYLRNILAWAAINGFIR
jgi:hypothetical protein